MTTVSTTARPVAAGSRHAGMVFAGVVMVVHLAFIVFVAVGALLAWRWPRIVWLHLPALAWGVGIIAIGDD